VGASCSDDGNCAKYAAPASVCAAKCSHANGEEDGYDGSDYLRRPADVRMTPFFPFRRFPLQPGPCCSLVECQRASDCVGLRGSLGKAFFCERNPPGGGTRLRTTSTAGCEADHLLYGEASH